MESKASETLVGRWMGHAGRQPEHEAVIHLRARGSPVRWTWGRLLERATDLARQLRHDGIRRGEVCAILVRHHPDFYPLYIAVELIGAIPAVLAYPNARLHPDKFRAGLAGMARHSGLDWLLTETSLEPALRPLVLGQDATIRGLLHPLEGRTEMSSEAGATRDSGEGMPDEPSLLQHSSGTTGLQKAVMLSHRAVLRHVENYARAIRLSDEDRIVSWLPLYHDMGLIAAFHLPLATAVTTVQIDPFEWIGAPALFLEALWKERGTIAWLPNFAYNLMATRVHDEELEGVRLDHVRLLINCSEPVREDSMTMFARRFAGYGLRVEALGACYAMAEMTFAVTQTDPGEPARVLCAARDDLRAGRFRASSSLETSRAVVSSGRAISGCEVKVMDEASREVDDGHVGELAIRSDSMFMGYRGAPDATASVLREGWYWSGDSGFVLDGEVYVIGRKKDLIIVAGKNLYPEDIEDAIGTVEGIIPGRVVAFGVDDDETGTQQVWVAAETETSSEGELHALRSRVVAAGMAIDVTIAETKLVPPRWLIKSSAGKLSRSANKERLLSLSARVDGSDT